MKPKKISDTLVDVVSSLPKDKQLDALIAITKPKCKGNKQTSAKHLNDNYKEDPST